MKKNGVGVAVLALFATLTHAEDYLSPTEERVRLSLGIVRVSNNTDLQIDSSTGVPGTPINAEDQFGLDKADYEAKIQAITSALERTGTSTADALHKATGAIYADLLKNATTLAYLDTLRVMAFVTAVVDIDP